MKRCLLMLAAVYLWTEAVCPQTVLRLEPSAAWTSGSAVFSVAVAIEDVQQLTAASVSIGFNSSLVEFRGAAAGTFLPNSFQYIASPTIKDPNTVTVDQAILGGGTVSGSGVLFTMWFMPRNACALTFAITSATLMAPENVRIAALPQQCTVHIRASVACRALLQGPFDLPTLSMRSMLNSAGRLPAVQPYAAPPWNYAVPESVEQAFLVSHPEIVDWVLVEVRTGTEPNSVMAKRSGFILRNGAITDLDGMSPLQFDITAGNYYLVVRHRSHCALMTRAPVPIDALSPPVDFTRGPAAVYGDGQVIELGPGIYGMPAGDANGDGQITGSDFNRFFPAYVDISTGYRDEDLSMDGSVTGTDFNLFFQNFAAMRRTAVSFN